MAAKAAKKPFTITSREEADTLLEEISNARRWIANEEARFNEAVNAGREAMIKKTAADRETIAENEAALEAWAEANKKELFTEPRSLELNYGKLGFRLTPWKIAVIGKLKVETIIERLRAARLSQLIRKTESIDKEAALNYDNDDLAKAGLKKVQTDEFWYEIKSEEVV